MGIFNRKPEALMPDGNTFGEALVEAEFLGSIGTDQYVEFEGQMPVSAEAISKESK